MRGAPVIAFEAGFIRERASGAIEHASAVVVVNNVVLALRADHVRLIRIIAAAGAALVAEADVVVGLRIQGTCRKAVIRQLKHVFWAVPHKNVVKVASSLPEHVVHFAR